MAILDDDARRFGEALRAELYPLMPPEDVEAIERVRLHRADVELAWAAFRRCVAHQPASRALVVNLARRMFPDVRDRTPVLAVFLDGLREGGADLGAIVTDMARAAADAPQAQSVEGR